MIPIKTEAEISKMRAACRIAADVLESLARFVEPGMSTYDLDQQGKSLIEGYGAKSACYDYKAGTRRYPAYTCISVNEEVVHGIGSKTRMIQPGDAVSLDVCVIYEGFVGDNARTILVGSAHPETARLVKETQIALGLGIQEACVGNRIGDISAAIQQHIQACGFSIVRDFVGHGVGRSMHEEPQIPNFGRPGAGPKLSAGMTLAIEPMVNMGNSAIEYAPDGWTALTRDRKPSAHFEHTVLITPSGPEVLTISNL